MTNRVKEKESNFKLNQFCVAEAYSTLWTAEHIVGSAFIPRIHETNIWLSYADDTFNTTSSIRLPCHGTWAVHAEKSLVQVANTIWNRKNDKIDRNHHQLVITIMTTYEWTIETNR